MNAKELAATLNGRECANEITDTECAIARKLGLVVVFGASDDLIELRGAVDDEVNAYNGGECYIKNGKLLPALDDEQEIEVLEKHGVLESVQSAHKTAMKIEGKWDCNGYSWFITTSHDFEPFEIMENGDKFCRGIVTKVV